MDNTWICNGMPTYKEANVAKEVLHQHVDRFLQEVQLRKEERKFLLISGLDQGWDAFVEGQKEALTNAGVQVVRVPAEEGFLYTVPAAVNRVIQGMNPVPLATGSLPTVVTTEELLNLGDKWVFVSGRVKNKGLLSLPCKTTPRQLLEVAEPIGTVKGMFFGYPMDTYVTEEALDAEMVLTTDQVWVYNEEDCMLDQLYQRIQHHALMACGGCVMGYEGVFQIQTVLGDWIQKKGRAQDFALLTELGRQMQTQCMCQVGKSAAGTLLGALNLFQEELEAHVTKKTCKASVCKKFVTYHIDPDRCTGCMECLDVCEDEAILGKKRFIHVIDLEECTLCGKCLNVCDEEAIFTAGAIKPRGPKKPIPCKS